MEKENMELLKEEENLESSGDWNFPKSPSSLYHDGINGFLDDRPAWIANSETSKQNAVDSCGCSMWALKGMGGYLCVTILDQEVKKVIKSYHCSWRRDVTEIDWLDSDCFAFVKSNVIGRHTAKGTLEHLQLCS